MLEANALVRHANMPNRQRGMCLQKVSRGTLHCMYMNTKQQQRRRQKRKKPESVQTKKDPQAHANSPTRR
ncbi:hypothetical protein TRIATDRAFT_297081 [Trichoderma atroviride IMI 206040]|uniref:Uncharacterized protein n=1 Tax=Hypocrea atroviridis (strain ATCC 20476 / IMI 206040) TaxID=452589 RepID=G9NFK7_HYPAI|nr:uncharacterized protein TRIATDRAFT_297081 [Trichoderma atroviride IMI 206040]EHK50722.1 hypothetical protein TRIATDRAFT_297081 [Trichoderma atroviride IMI 206040]